MTFFQRIKTPFTESPADDQARLQPRLRLVGELLQERREDLGLDLDEIGAMLRIKPAYLAALEQGRSHDLPGPTYAIGFVRAYAEFLGLEAEPVLARFKAEAAGVTARPDLALPVPLGERSVPGGALVLVALIVALCGYGIWYYLSTEERARPERVASVPASLQAQAQAPALVTPANTGNTATEASPPGSSQPAQPSLFGATAGSAAQTPMPPGAGAAPQPLAAPTTPVPASVSPSPQPSAAPATALSQGALITPIPHATSASPPSSAQSTSAAPPPAAPAVQATAAAPSPSTAQAAPAAAGAATGRVSIRAAADCWIQVRAPDQSIVFSRVLKSGEVYTVPARAGLSLRTGNAGVLEIAVDGKTVPSIGGVGVLRRDVSLDPAELAAGTAVHG